MSLTQASLAAFVLLCTLSKIVQLQSMTVDDLLRNPSLNFGLWFHFGLQSGPQLWPAASGPNRYQGLVAFGTLVMYGGSHSTT